MLAMTEKQTGLRKMRQEMEPRVTQETVARSAGVLLNTYQKAEHGGNVRFRTASKILVGFNKIRKERGLEDVDIWALGLSIS